MGGPYAVVFIVTFTTTLVMTPIVRRLALRRNLLVSPGERRVHEVPMPNLGGVAMVLGVMVGMLVAALLGGFSDVFQSSTAPLGIALAAAVIFGVGLIDDVRKVHGEGVSAPAKLAGIVLAGGILSLAGVSTIFFRVPFFGVFSLTPDLSSFITVLWVAGMANAIRPGPMASPRAAARNLRCDKAAAQRDMGLPFFGCRPVCAVTGSAIKGQHGVFEIGMPP